MATKRFTFTRNSLCTFGAIAFFILLASSQAGAQSIWTHAAAACTVDEGSVTKHEFSGARFRFKPDG